MIRGTTPTFNFILPTDIENIEDLSIAFAQDKVMILEKKKEDVSIIENKIVCALSQADTLKFKGDKVTELQLRIKFSSGKLSASKIFKIETYRIIRDGLL